MSEKFPNGEVDTAEASVFSVSHEEALANPDARGEYSRERLEMMKSGYPVWIIMGIEAQLKNPKAGIRYFFYHGNKWRGFVEGKNDTGYLAYSVETEPAPEGQAPNKSFRLLNREPLWQLDEAQLTLEDYLSR